MQVAPKQQGSALETRVELPANGAVATWNEEIFEIPFQVRDPEAAMEYYSHKSEAVTIGNHQLRVATKLEDRSFGFYIILEKVILKITRKLNPLNQHI